MKGLILNSDTGQKERALEQFKKAREWRHTGYRIPSTMEEVKSGHPSCPFRTVAEY